MIYVAGGHGKVVHILRPGSTVVALCGKSAEALTNGRWGVREKERPSGPICLRCAARQMNRHWRVVE